jgi:hypothetical protein
MLIYIGLTQPVDRDTEEEIEAHLHKWFHRYRSQYRLAGIFPYDPVMMEFVLDIGEQVPETIAQSLQDWIDRLGLDHTDVLISDRSVLEGMTEDERCEHLKRKMRFLLESVRQIHRGSNSARHRQLEYLLAGACSETDRLLMGTPSLSVAPSPVQEKLSREIDEFWQNL